MSAKRNKGINLDNPRSWDYFKKISLAGRVKIIGGDGYDFLSFISGRSFRDLKKADKENIKNKLTLRVKKEVNSDFINYLFDKKLIVKLRLFLNQSYYNRVDVDNVAKTVLDCMQGVIYKNDKQVIHLEATKIKVHKGDKGAIYMAVLEWLAIRRVYK